MINTGKILGKIKENGFTLSDFAARIGVSRPTLTAKIHNKSSFSVDEMNKVRKELQLTDEDCKLIFFATD